jgi:methylphosphotriester-DNA--protein-cysteine methyltransferase
LRLLHAVAELQQGASVTEAGAAAGYASTSAFVQAFRSQLGETPHRFARRTGMANYDPPRSNASRDIAVAPG